jgi:hypothetical protein
MAGLDSGGGGAGRWPVSVEGSETRCLELPHGRYSCFLLLCLASLLVLWKFSTSEIEGSAPRSILGRQPRSGVTYHEQTGTETQKHRDTDTGQTQDGH